MSSRATICKICGASFRRTLEAAICEGCQEFTRTVRVDDLPKRQSETTTVATAIAGHDLIETIGVGGMGMVYRARQDCLERDVAAKVIFALQDDEEGRNRFFREARVLAQLDHPNIIPIYSYGTDAAGRCYYTMKLVRGRTLQKILHEIHTRKEKWSLEQLLAVFRKVCDAVAFAHSRGVLHRDLKPDNIMVGEFGEVLVMDWGCAGELKSDGRMWETRPTVIREAALASEVELTLCGAVLGTPQYMAPEQAEGRTDLDERCDVYALGGILFTILSLKPPLAPSTIDAMLESVRLGKILPFTEPASLSRPENLPWRIPAALQAIVKKAMKRERSERFKSVRAFAADIDAHLAGYATSALNISPAGQLWLLIKRHRTVSAALLILLVVSAVFVAQLVKSERRATLSADIAQQNEFIARQAEKESRDFAEAARVSLAQSKIALADSSHTSNAPQQMRAALDSVPEDLRDTSWHYLNGRSDDRKAMFKYKGDGFLVGVVPHPTEPHVFTVATPPAAGKIVDFDATNGAIVREFDHPDAWTRALSYSPDGQKIAAGSIMGHGISIYRLKDGAKLLEWKTPWTEYVEYFPDGVRLLDSSTGACVVWDSTTGKRLWKYREGSVHRLLPGGNEILSIGENCFSVLSSADGSVIRTHPLRQTISFSAALSPKGDRFVISHLDGQIAAYNVADGSTIFDIPSGENGEVRRTQFYGDATRFVSVSGSQETSQSIQVRDAATGRSLGILRGGMGGIECVAIHPNSGELVVTATSSSTWAAPGHLKPDWNLTASSVVGGFFGGEDHFLAPTAPADSQNGFGIDLALIQLSNGKPTWKLPQPARSITRTSSDGKTAITCIQGSPTNGTGAVGLINSALSALAPKRTYDANFQVFRYEDSAVRYVRTLTFCDSVRDISLSPNGSRVAFAAHLNGFALFDVSSGKTLPLIYDKAIASNYAIAWHGSDMKTLYSLVAMNGRRGHPNCQEWLLAWDTDTGQKIAAARHATPMKCIASEPGGTRIAEAGDDKLIRIRDGKTLEVLREFRAHDGAIETIAWNPAFPVIATGSEDRTIRLWDTNTGRMIEQLHIGLREPTALYFSPSGKRLACVIPGENTLIWELGLNQLSRR